MKYLITGCAGFIGYHVTKFLLKKNVNVVGIDSLNSYYDPKLKKDRLKDSQERAERRRMAKEWLSE